MAKFKVGDRVKIISGGYGAGTKCANGDIAVIAEAAFLTSGSAYKLTGLTADGRAPRLWLFFGDEIELAEPAEHPALTLAKAEVIRLSETPYVIRSCQEDARLAAFIEVLRAFGLEYRRKQPVPQPVEYEFVEVSK